MPDFIELIEFHITEHCNLNCKSCMHFSPLAEKEFVKISEFKRDIKKLFKITKGRIKTINLLGGEPLLHPELKRILKIARQYFKNSEIKLISNGILLSKEKEIFWKTLKNFDIHLSVTKYPLQIDYRQISRLVQKFGIKYSFYASDKENSQWYFPLDLSGMQNGNENFKVCGNGNNCTNLNVCKGRIYICPIVSNIKHFNKFFNTNLPLDVHDYLNLASIENMADIIKYASSPVPFCRFCDTQRRTFNNKWEISKKDMKEWV